MFRSIRNQVETLLKVKIPFEPEEIRLAKYQPSPDLMHFQAYIKIGAAKDEYIQLAKELHLHQRGETPDAGMYLPASWDCEAEAAASWWNPTAETPDNAAARQYGVNGWVVAKYENGAIYINLTDTGSEGGEPGPW